MQCLEYLECMHDEAFFVKKKMGLFVTPQLWSEVYHLERGGLSGENLKRHL